MWTQEQDQMNKVAIDLIEISAKAKFNGNETLAKLADDLIKRIDILIDDAAH